jgi:hypothetical protein
MASPVTFDLTLAADTDRACDGRLYAIRAAPQPSAEDGTAAVVWQSRLVDVLALR